MRNILLFLLAAFFSFACGSSQGMHQDAGEATVTESRSDVSGCEYVSTVSATIDLREFDEDRAAAMEALFDRLRNATLQKRCDTVYLINVEETTTHLTAVGEGYRCESVGITGGPMGGNRP